VSAALTIALVIAAGGGVYAFIRMLPTCSQFMRGKIVSRTVIRYFGLPGAWSLRLLLCSAPIAMSLFDVAHTAQKIIAIAVNVWMIDDWLTSDDDRRRRWKDVFARIKLRMPKPVKLRPAERWASVPA
jgi:hypothetical protein